MQEHTYVPFTKEMIREYTILIPNMLPMHFSMLAKVLENYGYKTDILTQSGPEVTEAGLAYVHNDTCYPAILVIGQFIHALQSGKYDPHKVALILFQTGGGCRASNYISLLRKALAKAGYSYIPVIAFGFKGIERHSGFSMTLPQLHRIMYAFLYGDLLMHLTNQCKPYERERGAAQKLADAWTGKLGRELARTRCIRYGRIKRNYASIVASFAALPMEKREVIQVGIVGEIYVKYSPLGNNQLEAFLQEENAQVVVPGVVDFLLYSLYNNILDYKLYGKKKISHLFSQMAFDLLCRKKQDINCAIQEHSRFDTITSFQDVIQMSSAYIGNGVKMGEGWLLTAEMLELANSGVKNIVCVQPFGCLPNHICGKGMMGKIRAKNPEVNIVAVDYDPGASRINQENRIKLMLANAREGKGRER